MIANLRIALICMIVLALPVQGIAAATMRFCTPGHHPQTQHSASAHAGHQHRLHAPASARAHQHDEHVVAGVGHDASKDVSGAAKMKCSVCAACCMAAALAPATPTVGALEAGSKITLPAAVSYVGPFADGLERPPRPCLA